MCKCKFHCADIPYQQKLKIFNDFYALKDNVKQNSYVMNLIHVCGVKIRRHGNYVNPEESRRQATLSFTLPDGAGNILQVCRNTFCTVLGITRKRIETLSKLKKQGETVYIEKRGNKQLHRKFTPDDEALVIDHINRFPREEGHYNRLKSEKQYLSPDLNINRLYSVFKEAHPASAITYRFYYKVFKKKNPKLCFHKPRTDTCATCDLLHIQTKNPTNRDAKIKLEMHHRKAEAAMAAMRRDHQECQQPGSDTMTLSMDLEQVLSLPTLTHGQMYYLRQLSNYNLCVHLGDNNTGYMFLWHEGISGRGGNEIASCMLKALYNMPTEKRKITVWSDNCAGQNKNKMLLFLWVYLVLKGPFDEIDHKYLVSGHSFMSCDRDFAQIEKRKRLEKCEVPMDLVRMMVKAVNRNPFVVTVMNPEDFFDFRAASEKVINTSKLQISKAQWINITRENPGVIKIRETLNEMEPWKTMNVMKKNVTSRTITEMSLPILNCKNSISDEKKRNLQEMIPYLTEENKQFYENLVNSND